MSCQSVPRVQFQVVEFLPCIVTQPIYTHRLAVKVVCICYMPKLPELLAMDIQSLRSQFEAS